MFNVSCFSTSIVNKGDLLTYCIWYNIFDFTLCICQIVITFCFMCNNDGFGYLNVYFEFVIYTTSYRFCLDCLFTFSDPHGLANQIQKPLKYKIVLTILLNCQLTLLFIHCSCYKKMLKNAFIAS